MCDRAQRLRLNLGRRALSGPELVHQIHEAIVSEIAGRPLCSSAQFVFSFERDNCIHLTDSEDMANSEQASPTLRWFSAIHFMPFLAWQIVTIYLEFRHWNL